MAPPLLRHLSGALLATALLSLSGCETVQFGPDPVTPADSASAEATLLFVNKRETDPGSLVLLLYPHTSSILEDAVPVKEYPEVAFDQSASLKVAAGRYKLAYRMEGGDLRPMPPKGDEGVNSDWPVATFAAGKSYGLLIETDDGNNTVWRTDIPVSSSP
jgi:hypothetical protein